MDILPLTLKQNRVKTLHGDAWHYDDVLAVMDWVENYPEPYMLSGGDVLDSDFSYSSDWYYNYSLQYDMITNKAKSFQEGREYIQRYANRSGCDVYFTLTYHSCIEGKQWALARECEDAEAADAKVGREKKAERFRQMIAGVEARREGLDKNS